MLDVLTRPLGEFTLGWLLLSAGLGGLVGAGLKYLFEFHLPERMRSRREAEARLRKHTYPLLHAADAVEHRLNRMLSKGVMQKWLSRDVVEAVRGGGGFLSDPVNSQGYFFLSTLYVFARYFAWLEIMRRDVVYLDYSQSSKMKEFGQILICISNAFRNTDLWRAGRESGVRLRDSTKLYRHVQSAIGESMITEEDGRGSCISFREFAVRYTDDRDPAFRFWLRNLEDYFEGLGEGAPGEDFRVYRLALLELSFYDLVRFLDPDQARVQTRPTDHRSRIIAHLPEAERGAVDRLSDSNSEAASTGLEA